MHVDISKQPFGCFAVAYKQKQRKYSDKLKTYKTVICQQWCTIRNVLCVYLTIGYANSCWHETYAFVRIRRNSDLNWVAKHCNYSKRTNSVKEKYVWAHSLGLSMQMNKVDVSLAVKFHIFSLVFFLISAKLLPYNHYSMYRSTPFLFAHWHYRTIEIFWSEKYFFSYEKWILSSHKTKKAIYKCVYLFEKLFMVMIRSDTAPWVYILIRNEHLLSWHIWLDKRRKKMFLKFFPLYFTYLTAKPFVFQTPLMK